jgi:hypothetical protein
MLDVDANQIYESSTGETLGEIETLTQKQLEELLEGKGNE